MGEPIKKCRKCGCDKPRIYKNKLLGYDVLECHECAGILLVKSHKLTYNCAKCGKKATTHHGPKLNPAIKVAGMQYCVCKKCYETFTVLLREFFGDKGIIDHVI